MIAPQEKNSEYVLFARDLERLAREQPHLSEEEKECREKRRRQLVKLRRTSSNELYEKRRSERNAERRIAKLTSMTVSEALMTPSTPPSVQDFQEELDLLRKVLTESPNEALLAQLEQLQAFVREKAAERQRGGGEDRVALQRLHALSLQVAQHTGEAFCPFDFAEQRFQQAVDRVVEDEESKLVVMRADQTYLCNHVMKNGRHDLDAQAQIPYDVRDIESLQRRVQKIKAWSREAKLSAAHALYRRTKRFGSYTPPADEDAEQPAAGAADEDAEQPAAGAADSKVDA